MANFATEGFTAADGTTLQSAGTWTKHTTAGAKNIIVATNRVRADSGAGTALYYHTGTPAGADYEVAADLYVASAAAGDMAVCGRMDTTAATFYMARYSTAVGAWQLYKCVAGTFTQLGSDVAQSLSVSTSYAVKLKMVGTTIELYKEGSATPAISVTDSAISAAGKAGLRVTSTATNTTSIHLDNFTADDIVAAAPTLGDPPATAWYNSSWLKRKPLGIVAETVASDVTDLPIPVVVTDDAEVMAAAQRDGRDILFTDASGTKLAHELMDYWAGLEREAGWVWFTRPSAVHFSGTNDRTYVTYQKNDGAITIAQYDHTAGSWATPFDLHAAGDSTNLYVQEDHGPASILVRASDSKLMTFYAGHSGPDIHMRISTNAEDATAWGTETNLDSSIGLTGYSYPCPVQFADGTIWLIFRCNLGSAPTRWYYSQSTDDGATWSAGTEFFTTAGYGYTQVVQNGDTLYFSISPDHPRLDSANSLYAVKYIKGTGWQEMDGTSLTIPMTEASLSGTQVYSGAGADGRAWTWDIAVGSDGHPRIAYARLGDTANHKMRFARWTGTAWDDQLIVNSGDNIGSLNPDDSNYDDPWYSGGVGFDHDDPNTLYVAAESTGVHELYKYVTADNGATWTTTAITSDSKHRNFRPICPRDHHADLEVFWRYGAMPDYTKHLTGVTMYPLTAPRVQELQARVKVPTIANATDTWVWMYYGNPAATAQENRAGTYPATWKLVVQGRESYAANPAALTDSTGAVTITASANNRPREAKLAEFRSLYFDGTDYASGTLNMAGWSALTLLSHINWAGTPTTDEHTIFNNWSNTEGGIIFRVDPTTSNKLEAFARVAGDVQKGGTAVAAVTANTDTVVGMQYSSTNGIRVWKNGASETLASSTGGGTLDTDTSNTFAIGRYSTDFFASPAADASGEYFKGYIGPLWIADTELADDWVIAWSDSALDPTGFAALGTEEAAPAGATITLTGIASAEAFGTATVVRASVAQATLTGIPSAEAFGDPTVARSSVAAATLSGIPSAEAFGTASVSSDTTKAVTLTGIPSGEAFGTAAVARTSLAQITLAGIASAEAFGAATVTRSGSAAITLTGIASGEAFGAMVVGSDLVASDTLPVEAYLAAYLNPPQGADGSHGHDYLRLGERIARRRGLL